MRHDAAPAASGTPGSSINNITAQLPMHLTLNTARLAGLSALLLVLGVMATGFAAKIFLTGHERTTQAQRAEHQAQLLASSIQALVKHYQLLAQRVAAHATEATLLSDKKTVDRGLFIAQASVALPSVLKLRLLPTGVHEPDGGTPELSFACFDQIARQTGGDKTVAAELHMAGTSSAHIDILAPIVDQEDSKKILGHALLIVDPAALRQSLELFRAEHGFMELHQAAGKDDLLVMSAGDARHKLGNPVSALNIRDTTWRLSYWPSDGVWSPTTQELLLGGGSAALAILSLLLAIVLPRRWLATSLRRDAETFSSFFHDVRTGVLMSSYSFNLGEFNDLARQLRSSGEEIIKDRRALEQRDQSDPLTGVASRSFFEHKLEQMLQQARLGLSSALMLADIDRLKEINAKIGTEAGDTLLRHFSRQLRGALRTGDTVARLESGRFAVLFAFTDLDNIQPLIERLRQHLTEEELDASTGLPRAFSWSAGLTLISKDDRDVVAILTRSEAGLATAQREGGNRTVTHMPPA